VAIAGPSGSGKTSLLLLAWLERPAARRICFAGTYLATQDADVLADLRRDRIGFVFQSFHLLPSLSALDNSALPLQMAGAAGARQTDVEMLTRAAWHASSTGRSAASSSRSRRPADHPNRKSDCRNSPPQGSQWRYRSGWNCMRSGGGVANCRGRSAPTLQDSAVDGPAEEQPTRRTLFSPGS